MALPFGFCGVSVLQFILNFEASSADVISGYQDHILKIHHRNIKFKPYQSRSLLPVNLCIQIQIHIRGCQSAFKFDSLRAEGGSLLHADLHLNAYKLEPGGESMRRKRSKLTSYGIFEMFLQTASIRSDSCSPSFGMAALLPSEAPYAITEIRTREVGFWSSVNI